MIPVGALPADILRAIFRLLINSEGCTRCVCLGLENDTLSKYPILLSHVCSHWRRTAIESGALWSHIDLSVGLANHRGLLTRAKAFLDRAGRTPLDIHIVDPIKQTFSEAIVSDLMNLVHSVGAIRSLTFCFRLEVDLPGGLRGYISHILVGLGRSAQFIPGAHLEIKAQEFATRVGDGPQLIESELEDKEEHPDVQRLDDFLQPTSVLKLRSLCPRWLSKAYHGLVELWIDSGIGVSDTSFTQPQLATILESSPKLRILGFYGTIVPAGGNACAPVYLNDLEVLIVLVNKLSLLLDLIAPGKKPLYLSLPYHGGSDEFGHEPTGMPTGVGTFLLRSNVTTFHLYDLLMGYDARLDFLRLTPGIRTLVLGNFWRFTDIIDEESDTIATPHLENVYVLEDSMVPIDNLRQTLLTKFRVQKIIFSITMFRVEGSGLETIEERELVDRLVDTGVMVEVLGTKSLPPRVVPRFGYWDDRE